MKYIYVLLLCTLAIFTQAQTYDQVALGANYSNQVYYNLSSGAQTILPNDSWDLAFTAFGFQDAGIHINESSSSSFTAPLPELELFVAASTEWDLVTDTVGKSPRQYNDEQSWSYGAFNNERDANNPADFGWGMYNFGAQSVEGNKVFLIKLRDNTWRKFEITALAGTTYMFRHAKLDGSEEKSMTINKLDHTSGIILYSIGKHEIVEAPKHSWDLAFMRYITMLDDSTGTGNTIDYSVTGGISNWNTRAALADGVDPEQVDGTAYKDQLSSQLDIIGHDWKHFVAASGWIIDEDRAYFVEDGQKNYWKLIMVDFEGVSTGVITFTKELLTTINTVEPVTLGKIQVFPNPLTASSVLSIDMDHSASLEMYIIAPNGQSLMHQSVELSQGSQQVSVGAVASLPQGSYTLVLRSATGLSTMPLVVTAE